MTLSVTIEIALKQANQALFPISDTPLLDAEILLAHVLQVSRSYLFAFSERELTLAEKNLFQTYIEQRKSNIPIAYIVGHKEFWSLDLIVTRDTLIPRPETELLVECVLQQISGPNKVIADLGTGSGAIALALASEQPSWEIHATDVSLEALKIAKQNADRLKLANVIFHHGNWFDALPVGKKFDMIVSNPPYISADDPHLRCNNLKYEPQSALISNENGLADIRHIIKEAKQYLQPEGKLLLEHGFSQAVEIRKIFEKMGYSDINTYQDIAELDRVTGGVI